jgi:ABC-2 type transport system permease protein
VGSLLTVAAAIALLVVVWDRLVSRSLERVDASGGRRRRRTTLSPALLAPLTMVPARTGAITAKDLRYLVRDPRRLISLMIGVLMPALLVVLGPAASGRGVPAWSVFVVCLVALFGGLAGGNRFGQDGTATWMLLSTQVERHDPRRDLLGGDLATLLVLTPLLVLTGALVATLGAGDRYLVAALGYGLALLLLCVAASGITAVIAPWTVPANPGNPFSGGNAGAGCFAGLVGLGCVAASAVTSLPLLAVLVPALHSRAWGWVLLAVGPVYGLAVGHLLREMAARRWRKRGPEILQLLATTQS